jgi:hypothetical protein
MSDESRSDRVSGRQVKRIRIVWTCSNHTYHEHRWEWTAWLCGQVQRAYWFARAMIAR